MTRLSLFGGKQCPACANLIPALAFLRPVSLLQANQMRSRRCLSTNVWLLNGRPKRTALAEGRTRGRGTRGIVCTVRCQLGDKVLEGVWSYGCSSMVRLSGIDLPFNPLVLMVSFVVFSASQGLGEYAIITQAECYRLVVW